MVPIVSASYKIPLASQRCQPLACFIYFFLPFVAGDGNRVLTPHAGKHQWNVLNKPTQPTHVLQLLRFVSRVIICHSVPATIV